MNEKKAKTAKKPAKADREVIEPRTEKQWLAARSKDITSTEISALFNCNPYTTYFETWHRHFGDLQVDFKPNERTIWGERLETSIAKGVAQDKGWEIRRMSEYIRIPKHKAGASFDFSIENDQSLMEIKNVDSLAYKEGWLEDEDGNIEAPPHIELQIQHQLIVSGRSKAYLVALVGGNRVKVIERALDIEVMASIYDKVDEFWVSIDAKKEPVCDFSRDWQTIKRLYGQVESGKVFDVRGNSGFDQMLSSYKDLKVESKGLEEKLQTIKTRILMNVGDAEKVIGDGFSISLGIVKGGPVSYQREDYRNFRVNFKKEKS